MAGSELLPGSRFAGYEIIEVLGRGGMGVVYKARDAKRDRVVAIKVASPLLAADPDFIARFRREGRASATIAHPNVVALLETGEEEGTPFLAFECVEGGTLDGLLRENERLGWREAAALAAQIARGLAAVHAAGLVHRDLKPSNVLLTFRRGQEIGEPKLSDFGLVGAHASSLAVSRALTKTGDVLGTLEYVSPEQVDGRKAIDSRSDLYGLGALLYALLAGHPPFQGEGYGLLKKHALEKPRPPRELVPDLPERLDRLILGLLEKKPEDRPQTADEVARELATIAREGKRAGGRATLVPSAVLLALAVAALGMIFAATRPDESAAPGPPAGGSGTAVSTLTNGTPAPSLLVPRLVEEARAKAKQGDREGALADLSRAIELSSRCAAAWLERGKIRLEKQDPDSLYDLGRAVELDPTSSDAWAQRGLARRTLGNDPDGTIADATRAIELDPKNGLAWELRAGSRTLKGELDDAIQDLTRCIELDPLGRAWSLRGAVKRKKGDLQGAVDDLTRSLELHPEVAQDWSARGGVRLELRDLDGAIADETRALELDARCRAAHDLLGTARIRKGDYEGAAADYRRWTELDPKETSAWEGLGYALLMKSDKGAIPALERARMCDPGSAAALCYLGIAKTRLQDVESALPDLDAAVRIGPKLPMTWAYRANARLVHGEPERAVSDATKAIDLDPAYPFPWLTRGLARKQLDQKDDARADLRHFLELEPQGGDAETARAKLEELGG